MIFFIYIFLFFKEYFKGSSCFANRQYKLWTVQKSEMCELRALHAVPNLLPSNPLTLIIIRPLTIIIVYQGQFYLTGSL